MSRKYIQFLCWLVLMAGIASGLRASEPYGLEQRVPIGAFLNNQLPHSSLLQTGSWAVVDAFTNLTVDDPVALVPEPNTPRLYVVSRQGQVFWFVNDPATSNKVEFLDMSAVTQGWDDCGMLGFAFHPEFGKVGSPNRGYFYVWYHYSPSPIPGPKRPPVNTPGYDRLSRFTVRDGSLVADRNSEQVLINQLDHNVWHDGSGMLFGPDGFLYLGLGDEGASFDSFTNSQTLTRGLFSGVVRIDVDQNPTRSHPIRRQPEQAAVLPSGFTENNYSSNYFIPNDNPFLDTNGRQLEEFWAIGLRNPHRLTLDPVTGRLWVGEIGQDKWEEVDIIERAGNYQWAYREGFHPLLRNNVTPIPKPAHILGIEKPPIYDYAHGPTGNCIIGGYVYRGAQFARELGGKYIFGDNGSGRLWSLSWDGTNASSVEYLCNMPPGNSYTGLSSFGIDQQNELYMCKMGRPSKIYKLIRADQLARPVSIQFEAPVRLSWLRLFIDRDNLTTIAGPIPYDVNSPLWSDGALKRRWILLPASEKHAEQITFSPSNEWSFPEGTVFIKNFDLVVNETNGATRHLETRFLVRDDKNGVYGMTYKWRWDNSEADLVSTPYTEQIHITTATGVRTQAWYFPGPLDCMVCHTPNAGSVLGVNARQLNRQFNYSTHVSDNQLRTWNHLGLFTESYDETMLTNLPALVRVDDPHASLETRVRSYLDANCAQCHRPNGVQGYFDARYSTPLAMQGLVDGPLVNPLGIPGAKVVSPGDLTKSVLFQRVSIVGNLQMPPLAKNVVDTNAVSTISQWIKGLPEAKK